MHHRLIATAAAIAFFGAATTASAGLITFDEPGLADGQNLAGSSGFLTDVPGITYGVNVSGPNAGTAIVWNTQITHGTGDPDIEGQFDDPTTPGNDDYNPGNILIIGNNAGPTPNDDPDGGSIEITFSQEVRTFSVKLYDTGDSGSTGVEVFVDGASQGIFGGGLGDDQFGEFTFGPASGTITSLVFSGSGGFDDLQFRAVPIPATLALLGVGLLGLGGLTRRRRF